jgi:membrane associated rhomboid family serine protease
VSEGEGERHETPKERADRELIELLNELRVALPGVQVLFAFLLAVPFARGWSRTSAFQRDVFFVAFVSAALSSALLIAPSSYHRLRFRAPDKARLVMTANALAIAGLVALAVSIVAVVLLVADFVFGDTVAVAATASIAGAFAALWYGLPVYGWARERRDERASRR